MMPERPSFEEIAAAVRTWGRWGDRDARGTLNYITDETRRRAAAAVRSGRAYTLGIPLSLDGPQDGSGIPGRINPVRTMLGINVPLGGPESAAYNDDIVVMPLQAATHWDALSHVSYRGLLYNGVPADTVTTAGASFGAIDVVGPLVSRGLLLDLPRHLGLDRLPGGFEVTRALLEECEAAQGEPASTGDVVLVRTGHMQVMHAGDVHGYHRPTPGLGIDTALWFSEREVAAVATDTIAFELLPSTCPELVLPLHVLCLVEMGLLQGQNWDLEELAAACAEDQRYTFLLDATPEPFSMATGSPVNPLALR
jgi:kynurenine formamidase